MVLTSTNNDAVDNIGLEILREVEYFRVIAENNLSRQYENENLKGVFCARLGKKDNMDSFNVCIMGLNPSPSGETFRSTCVE